MGPYNICIIHFMLAPLKLPIYPDIGVYEDEEGDVVVENRIDNLARV